jgi:hypothetical protein
MWQRSSLGSGIGELILPFAIKVGSFCTLERRGGRCQEIFSVSVLLNLAKRLDFINILVWPTPAPSSHS